MEQMIQKRIDRTDDGWIYVDGYGETTKPGLVIVPGVMSDAHSWRKVASEITAWPSVWVVNRRGRNPSGPLGPDYSMQTEVDDLSAVLDTIGEQRSLFGWSYGGSIALLLAGARAVNQLIAYEPVDPTFGNEALPVLRTADQAGDWDSAVRIVNEEVSGFTSEYVGKLRDNVRAWATLRDLSKPLYRELRALSESDLGDGLGSRAKGIDLIIGGDNEGIEPYGTAFQLIADQLRASSVTRLAGQGHLAHIEGPQTLVRLLNELGR
ncbi:alpha/beta hydrolase [Bacillus subtilis]|nr:alpha/beta hydrolase [Bacillus subtilis]WGP06838.1 alpha/beta hydrolase [Bacillus subtilis]WGP07748.1 alpha/beta hydrolase [Bacillus subtilis]